MGRACGDVTPRNPKPMAAAQQGQVATLSCNLSIPLRSLDALEPVWNTSVVATIRNTTVKSVTLARRYGVTPKTIYRVRHGLTWKV